MSGGDVVYGYQVDPAGLDGLASTLRDGAKAFDGITNGAPIAPDCGSSTARAAQAMAKLVAAGATLGGLLEDTANKIHSANGSYDTQENVVTKSMMGPQPS
jgi:hypothetical protein